MWQPQIVTGADLSIEGFVHEFESLRHSTECLFPPIRNAAAMVCFSSPRLTHKDSILHYTFTINAPNFAEVILNVVVCHHGLPGSVVTNSSALYPLELIIVMLLSMHQTQPFYRVLSAN